MTKKYLPINSSPDSKLSRDSFKKSGIPGVKKIIAVYSGKGGVGKSTVSALLSYFFAEQDLKVGILDADLYGPSQDKLFGISYQPDFSSLGQLIPPRSYGIKVMSYGILDSQNQAVIWKGPLISKAIDQLCYKVNWGSLDVLVIDMPPGTGDIPITVFEKVLVDSAVLVSTPQNLSVSDAIRSFHLMNKYKVPVAGVIENMKSFACGYCHEKNFIFGDSLSTGAWQKLDVEILGELSFDQQLAHSSSIGDLRQVSNWNELNPIFDKISKKLDF